MSDFDLAAAYRGAQERIAEIVRAAGGQAAAGQPVPATPQWTVHDVVAHVRGVLADGLSGNMKGAPGEEWTAAQVARGAGKPMELLLEEWADDLPAAEAVIAAAPSGTMNALILDVHTHEQDLRGALDAPGMRSGPFYEWATPQLAGMFRARSIGAGLPSVRIEADGMVIGDSDDPVVLSASQWELFRCVLGRRSADQVARLDWTGTAAAASYVPAMMVFGPAAADVVE